MNKAAPPQARVLPASAAGYQLPASAALCAVADGGRREALLQALLMAGMVTVRQCCDPRRAGTPTAALAVSAELVCSGQPCSAIAFAELGEMDWCPDCAECMLGKGEVCQN